MITFNSVYQFINDSKRIRTIHLDIEEDLCVYVYLEQTFSMPLLSSISEMQMKCDNAEIVEIADPYFMIKADKENNIFGALKLIEQLYLDGEIPGYVFRNILQEYKDDVCIADFTCYKKEKQEGEGK